MNRDFNHMLVTVGLWTVLTIANIFGKLGVTRDGYKPVKSIFVIATISWSVAGGFIVGLLSWLALDGSWVASTVGAGAGALLSYEGLLSIGDTVIKGLISSYNKKGLDTNNNSNDK